MRILVENCSSGTLVFRSTAQGDEKGNLTAAALEMSLKYKFVTPLTSMVVTKPDHEDIADKPVEGTYIFIRFMPCYKAMKQLDLP